MNTRQNGVTQNLNIFFFILNLEFRALLIEFTDHTFHSFNIAIEHLQLRTSSYRYKSE